ncbi:MAG: hypothetical protein HGA38_02785 [Candidatus Moranbacteria bacterium]|nr:hypothetical protein [Candidatus Moranbacteria bacterium]
MAQDMNVPVEGGSFEDAAGSVRSGREEIVMTDMERPAMQAVERSQERARETFSEILSKMPSRTVSPASDDEDDTAAVAVDAEAVFGEVDEEARVSKLLSLVEAKGPEYAVKVALHLNDYYALDRMHDALAERFYDALVAKGVIGRD